MRSERQGMKKEGRGARDEGQKVFASIVLSSEASGRLPFLAAVLLFLFLPSCGYRFSHVGGVVPEGARTIAVAAFINGTNEPYVDIEVTKAVADEFLADGRLKIVSPESADLVLKGTVTNFDLTPLSYSAATYVQQYRVSISLSVSIEDGKTRKILWQEKKLSSVFVSSYPVKIGDISATKIARESAIKTASQDVASTLRSRVLEGF